ncbi:glycoside hydrolase family 3 N-terminal domain-containing protein [Sphingomonas tabacisoli]|uniref:Glycoside hydrolase family 3 N-terminal domain-containing protein n=1 Tax=Sphingomonas tabacisoli TaxID=2249466 RepID=A0ABW4I0R2_9SPHN
MGATFLASAAPAFGVERLTYRDRNAPIDARVSDLLSRMTLEEKAAQLRSMWFSKSAILGPDGNFSPDKATKVLADGIGQIARPHDFAGKGVFLQSREIEDSVALVNAIQGHLVQKTRLGIPALFHEEGAHGYLARDSTIFPAPPALGSTWDPELVEQVFTAVAKEIRIRGGTIALAPVVDLARDPRYGRVEEFFGEDPRHVAVIGTAAVRGFQGRQRPLAKDRVFATLKHFVHGVPRGGLNIAPSDVSERTLRETFLVPFAEIVKAAEPAIIMPSYNEVQGIPAHANVQLLQGTGRRQLGFRGAYMSDYGGVANLQTHHHVAANKADAAVLAMNAGVQADLPDGECYIHLPELVRANRISETQIDSAVAQILALKFEAGLFENPYIDPKRAVRETNTAASVALARKAAQRAIVLLKNDGVVPLKSRAGLKLAVIGPNAEEALFGGYSGFTAKGVGVLAGLRNAAPKGVTLEYAEGVRISEPGGDGRHDTFTPLVKVKPEENRARIAQAVETASRSDVIVLALGDNPIITKEAVAYPMPGDRNSLELFGQQDELVEAMIATNKPIVALLLNGRALAVNRLAEKANALFEGWYLGQEGGNAFADILFGKVNPGGKLAVSFPRSAGELPVYYDRHPSDDVNQYVEGPRKPLFPFGHGLSYTTFDISAPRLSRADIGRGENVSVSVDVTNSGKWTGDEVVQLYIRDDVSSVPRPVLELKAFRRVTLAPGEMRTVAFDLTPDDLAFWDADMKWTVEPGLFLVGVGSSSVSLKTTRLSVA